MLLAVYGTLKKGYGNHRLLEQSKFVGQGWVKDYALLDHGWFPAAFPFDGSKIFVEVYEIDTTTLAHTDRLEGVGSGFYQRKAVETKFGQAFIYVQTGDHLKEAKTVWFPYGIWEGQNTEQALWLGWERERRLLARRRKNEAFVKQPSIYEQIDDDAEDYSPALRRSGRCEWDSSIGDYVPVERTVWSPPIKTDLVIEPKVPTKQEQIRSDIKAALAEFPDIPETKIA